MDIVHRLIEILAHLLEMRNSLANFIVIFRLHGLTEVTIAYHFSRSRHTINAAANITGQTHAKEHG